MLVARVIAKLEPGGAQLGAIRLMGALRDHGVASRLLVGEATPEGRQLLRDAELEWQFSPNRVAARYAQVYRRLLAAGDRLQRLTRPEARVYARSMVVRPSMWVS